MKTKKQTSKASKPTVIEIERKYKKEKYTIGALAINGQWICDTMEPHCIDWDKEVKIPGVTAIPEGTYELEMKRSKKFQKIMPYLKDVPNFTDIMIHTGNFPTQTKGCILVGFNTVRGLVLKSREAFEKILEKIEYALSAGKMVIVKVK
jgi:hypothetical protein